MIGIIAPLPQEAVVFRKGLKPAKQPIQISKQILLSIPGIGVKNARQAAEILTPKVSHLISWGTAAGLKEGVESGTLLLPGSVLNKDGTKLKTDSEFSKKLIAKLPEDIKYDRGILSESLTILNNKAEKLSFYELTQAVACDMESAAIGTVAQEHKIPFSAIRFVTDDSSATIPKSVLLSMDAKGHFNILKFLVNIIRSPGEITQVRQLSRNFSKAKKSMSITRDILMDIINSTDKKF